MLYICAMKTIISNALDGNLILERDDEISSAKYYTIEGVVYQHMMDIMRIEKNAIVKEIIVIKTKLLP